MDSVGYICISVIIITISWVREGVEVTQKELKIGREGWNDVNSLATHKILKNTISIKS